MFHIQVNIMNKTISFGCYVSLIFLLSLTHFAQSSQIQNDHPNYESIVLAKLNEQSEVPVIVQLEDNSDLHISFATNQPED